MNGTSTADNFHYSASITKDYSSLKTKVKAISSLTHKSYHLFEALLLFVEYFQLISQALLLTPALYNDPSNDDHLLFKGAVYCAKIFNLGFWVDIESYDALTFVVIALLVIFTIFKYALFLYIFIIVLTNRKGFEPLLFIWRLIFRSQGRVLCYFATSFWVQVILTIVQDDDGTITGVNVNSMKALASCMLGLEYLLSVSMQLRYSYVLPTKSFLSSKDNFLDSITLIQKIFIQILQLAFSSSTDGIRWVYASFAVVFSLLRETHYYATLPYYNMDALLYQGKLLMLVFSLNITSFIETLSYQLGKTTNMGFIVVIWILLALLTGKISNEYLKRIKYDLAYGEKKASVKLKVHKINALKSLLKQKQIPTESTSAYELAFVLNSAVPEDIEDILHLNPEFKAENEVNINSKRSRNLMFIQYLQFLRAKAPRSEFLKLYIAYFYARKLHLYGPAMKITNELKQSHSSSIALSASLLVYDIQESIKKQMKNVENALDILEYLQSRSMIAEIEGKMQQQIEIQSTLYNEILTEAPDLHKLVEYSVKINSHRMQIEKDIKYAIENIPGSFIKPLMLSSLYHLALNHSVSDYISYRKKYFQMYTKHERAFASGRMDKENAYQDNAVFMVVSAQKPDAGRIFYCSKSIRDIFGKEAHLCIGTMASTLSPPCFRERYGQFYENVGEKGDRNFLGKFIRDFAWHKQGYLVDCDFYVNIQPFLTQGFFLSMIIRPIQTSKDYILLHENGDIEGASKNVANKLGLLHSENFGLASVVNIKSLSPMLKKVSDAFNLIDAFAKSNAEKKDYQEGILSGISSSNLSEYQSPGRRLPKNLFRTTESHKIEMSLQKAQEFFNIFATEGQDLELTSLTPGSNPQMNTHVYNCKMENQSNGTVLMKLITLEERDSLQQGEEQTSIRKPPESMLAPRVINYAGDKTSEEEDMDEKMNEILDDSGDFNLEDEKNAGWIDLKAFDPAPISPYSRSMSPSIPFETIEEPLNSPMSVDGAMTTPKAPLILRTNNNIPNMFNHLSKSSKTHDEDHLKEEEHHAAAKAAFVVEGSIASQKSKSSQDRKISNAFKMALSVNYASGVFKIMTIVFYGLLITMFAVQLAMKNTLNTAVFNLRVGKDIVNFSEEQSFVLANILLSAKLILDIGTNAINMTALGAFGYPAAVYASFVSSDSRTLETLNQYLLQNSSYLNDDMRELLFSQDVRIFNTPQDRFMHTYQLVNSFQGIDRIADAGLQVSSIMQTQPVFAALQQIFFLLDNAANDIYLKNEATSDNFMAFLADERSSIDRSVTVNVIITVVLFTTVGVVLTAISWKNYFAEKSKLFAVAKLNSRGISNALDRITHFKRILEDEVTLNQQNPTIVIGNDRVSVKEVGFKKKDKREHLKVPKHTGILRKYIFYSGRLWFFIICLTGLSIAHCLIGKSSLTFFQQKQAQLYFSQRLKSEVTLIGVMVQELFSGNGTTLNLNEAVSELLPDSITYVNNMKISLPSTYLKSDLTYDPDIYDLLFGAGCPAITDPIWFSFCVRLGEAGQKTGLIYVLGDFLDLSEDKVYKFNTMDRSTQQALAAAQVDNFERIVTDYFTIANECAALTEIINQQFDDELSSAADTRNTIFTIFVVLLVFLGVLIWIFVLLKLKDFSHELKIVLQAFPPGLVLSSFPLKTFLVKTSKGALDFVKNEI